MEAVTYCLGFTVLGFTWRVGHSDLVMEATTYYSGLFIGGASFPPVQAVREA